MASLQSCRGSCWILFRTPQCLKLAWCSGLGIPLATLAEEPKLSVVIDGADEVDPELNVVKGRGGALLREKVNLWNFDRTCDNHMQ